MCVVRLFPAARLTSHPFADQRDACMCSQHISPGQDANSVDPYRFSAHPSRAAWLPPWLWAAHIVFLVPQQCTKNVTQAGCALFPAPLFCRHKHINETVIFIYSSQQETILIYKMFCQAALFAMKFAYFIVFLAWHMQLLIKPCFPQNFLCDRS